VIFGLPPAVTYKLNVRITLNFMFFSSFCQLLKGCGPEENPPYGYYPGATLLAAELPNQISHIQLHNRWPAHLSKYYAVAKLQEVQF
jgi:hypothetical protein